MAIVITVIAVYTRAVPELHGCLTEFNS